MDQGSIIFGVKSSFYPEYPCYGIITQTSHKVFGMKSLKLLTIPTYYTTLGLIT